MTRPILEITPRRVAFLAAIRDRRVVTAGGHVFRLLASGHWVATHDAREALDAGWAMLPPGSVVWALTELGLTVLEGSES
jgi:hypothetical protein